MINNVAYYRKKQKLSQKELAKMTSVSRQTINLIENNNLNPSLDLCKKIAVSLNTTLDNLFWINLTE